MKNGISFVQIVFILMLTNGLMNHVLVIPMMLDSAKRDSWISVLCSGFLYVLWTGLLYVVYKKTWQEHLLLWIKTHYGRGVALAVGLLLAIYCLSNATITIKDTIDWIHLSFAPQTPVLIHALIFSGLCFINAYLGIRSISLTSAVLLPVVVFLGFFVMTTNFQHKDYSYLLPVMEHGIEPVGRGMIYAGAGFAELIIFLLLKHHLPSKVRYFRILILALVMIGLTIGPTLGAVAEFGPKEAAKLRYPAYEEWRLANIGLYIEHLDFLSIYQWFSGSFTRVSLFFYLITELFAIPFGKKRTWFLACLFLFSTAVSLIPISDMEFYRWLRIYILPASLAVALFLSLLLFLLTAFAPRRNRSHES